MWIGAAIELESPLVPETTAAGHGLCRPYVVVATTYAQHPMSSVAASLRFASRFELQPQERRLLIDGVPANLGAHAFDVLLVLAERPDRLVTKRQLMDLVWPDVVVAENNIQQHISALRKLLGPGVIETIPGRGYRFIAPIDGSQFAAAATTRSSAAVSAAVSKTNLPAALPRLIGRDDDLAEVGALVERHRLVTITGAGGIGKSRLAQALLFERERQGAYAHGVCIVELAATADVEALPGVVGNALGVPGASSGEDMDSLVRAIGSLSMLIALDNAERLAAAVAVMSEWLLRDAPNVHLLVTSQVPLKLADERIYRLGPLQLPDDTPTVDDAERYGALALFAERARAVDRAFELTADNVDMVLEVCRRLDGVALAIELAAARMPLCGLAKLPGALDQRLHVLTAGSLTAPPRQQTLRAALEWSYGLLGEAEQKVFRRLAVFAGSASLEAVQRVAADRKPGSTLDEWAVFDALGALVDRSLVAVDGSDGAGSPHYRLLATHRAFALERLQAAGEEAAVRRP